MARSSTTPAASVRMRGSIGCMHNLRATRLAWQQAGVVNRFLTPAYVSSCLSTNFHYDLVDLRSLLSFRRQRKFERRRLLAQLQGLALEQAVAVVVVVVAVAAVVTLLNLEAPPYHHHLQLASGPGILSARRLVNPLRRSRTPHFVYLSHCFTSVS